MARLIALVIVATALAACAGHVADYIRTSAGGPPKDLPPRPGTPEYDAYRQKMDDEGTRDKSKDPPKPKTDPGTAGLPKSSVRARHRRCAHYTSRVRRLSSITRVPWRKVSGVWGQR